MALKTKFLSSVINIRWPLIICRNLLNTHDNVFKGDVWMLKYFVLS